MANCYACKAEIVFDNEHIGRNGKKIPLDPFTKQPHDCPMREKRWNSGVTDNDVSRAMGLEEEDEHRTEDKDDHGNEDSTPMHKNFDRYEKWPDEKPTAEKFVDHTTAAKGVSKVMIFSNETKADTQAEYNSFLEMNKSKIRTQGAHDHVTKQDETEPLVYTIYLYYEEVKT